MNWADFLHAGSDVIILGKTTNHALYLWPLNTGSPLYCISSNKHQASNKHCTFGYPHSNKCCPVISVSPLVRATPLNQVLIRIVTKLKC